MTHDTSVTGAIRDMAKEMRYRADELDRLADKMDAEENREVALERAGEALNIFANLTTNLRLDLIASRLYRETKRLKDEEPVRVELPRP